MRNRLFTAALSLAVLTPPVAFAADESVSYGVGPHGYDWMIGTWSCTNSMPTAQMPGQSTITVTKTNGGAIMFHHQGRAFSSLWYNVYVPSKKIWISPTISDDGSYGTESASQVGKTVVWSGFTYDPKSGKTTQWRDSFVNESAKFSYVGEGRSGNSWKAQYNFTCTKS